jgi:hypothetical protein
LIIELSVHRRRAAFFLVRLKFSIHCFLNLVDNEASAQWTVSARFATCTGIGSIMRISGAIAAVKGIRASRESLGVWCLQ